MRLRLGQRGDTLIEVTIALAILTFVLTGAFVTAHAAYVEGQTAKERSMLTDIAQQQGEALESFRDSHTWQEFVYGSTGSHNPSCTNNSMTVYCGVIDRHDVDCDQLDPGIQPCFHMELKKLTINGVTVQQWVPIPGGQGTGYSTSHYQITSGTNDPGQGTPLSYTFIIHNSEVPIGQVDRAQGHQVALKLVDLDKLR